MEAPPQTETVDSINPNQAPPTETPLDVQTAESRNPTQTPPMETGESSNPNPKRPAVFMTPKAELLESMMVKRILENKERETGPELPVTIWEVEGEGFVWVRVDMPGVNRVRVYYDPKSGCITFEGVEQEITMHNIISEGKCRTYQGKLYFDNERFDEVPDFSYGFRNGVLLLKIRCLKPATSAGLGVHLLTNQTTEEMKESARNPLVSHGLDRYALQSCTPDGSFVLAVDMPGLGGRSKLIGLAEESGRVRFLAEELEPVCPYEPKKKYRGATVLKHEEYKTSEAEFEFTHGVLWIQVPKVVKTSTDEGGSSTV